MSDKDRLGEIHGATDALRPTRPGGEPKTTGETDQRPDPVTAIPLGPTPAGTEASSDEEDRASGMIDDPISAGDGAGSNDYQAGDRTELAQQRGGPVDISRDRPKRRR
jgi:hypothetical protein